MWFHDEDGNVYLGCRGHRVYREYYRMHDGKKSKWISKKTYWCPTCKAVMG